MEEVNYKMEQFSQNTESNFIMIDMEDRERSIKGAFKKKIRQEERKEENQSEKENAIECK